MKTSKFVSRVYLFLILLFLFAPIFVLIFFSFNADKSTSVFGGFSFRWYRNLFEDEAALSALRNSLAGTEPEPVDGFTADQRFYLAYATLWGQNIRDEEVARLTKIDVHSLGKNRVNVTLRNIDSFFKAFGIEDGAMFRPEAERVIIW